MKFEKNIPTNRVAWCGVHCTACYVFLRKKKNCLGCRTGEGSKPEQCRKCKIKECAVAKGLTYCSECGAYPCAVLKRLEKSYNTRYGESLKAALAEIGESGIEAFLRKEKKRRSCPSCGGIVSMHDKTCSECGKSIG